MNNVGLEMFRLWKSSWENYIKTSGMVLDQGERMLDLVFGQSQTIQGETEKMIREGMAKAKEAQKSYFETMEENFSKIEELFGKSF